MFNFSPETAMRFTKFCVVILFTWPPWPEASKLEKNLFDIFSWLFMAFPLGLVIVLCNATRYQSDDYLELTKTTCMAVSCFHVFIKMLICKHQRPRLEVLNLDARNFFKNATITERKMLQYYVNRCGPVHLALNVCSLAASLAMICGPLILPLKLPIDVKYPFPVDDHPLREIAYLHQAIVGLQCSAIGAVDCHAAFLIWFAGARLQLLADEFKNVTDLPRLNICIAKHQILLRKTNETIRAVKILILTTTIMTTIAIITGGIHIVSKEPFVVKSQFFIIDFGLACVLFVTAWAAENLINVCTSVGNGAYEAPWTRKHSLQFRKNILFVMERSRYPSIISIASIIPELSLKYYTSFLSKSFSFFTTLRIVIGKIEDNTE